VDSVCHGILTGYEHTQIRRGQGRRDGAFHYVAPRLTARLTFRLPQRVSLRLGLNTARHRRGLAAAFAHLGCDAEARVNFPRSSQAKTLAMRRNAA